MIKHLLEFKQVFSEINDFNVLAVHDSSLLSPVIFEFSSNFTG